MEETEDRAMTYLSFLALCLMIGWLLYKYTGVENGMITPAYWAGFATPLFSQVVKQMFKLTKRIKSPPKDA